MGEEEVAKRMIVNKAKSLGYYIEANSGLLNYGEMVGLAMKTILGILMITDEGREHIYRESFLQYVNGTEDEGHDDKERIGVHAAK
jgi:hypothetical protein